MSGPHSSDWGRFCSQRGSMRDCLGAEGAVLYVDCGSAYKTLYVVEIHRTKHTKIGEFYFIHIFSINIYIPKIVFCEQMISP